MELSTNSSGLCCTSMQVLGGGRGLVLLVQQSKETSDCVVCFDSHRSEEPSEMRGTSRVALGFMKYYLRLQQAGSTVFGFDLWASAPLLPTPLGWNSSISSRQAEVVGYFYEMWVFYCVFVMLTDPQSNNSESLNQALLPHPLTV